jgi:glyoxylase-like metal-dependent hydrolase (beta-lactamase superfamily II)
MINKISDRVYYMPRSEATDRPALGLVCGDKYSLIVDSGNSPSHAREFLAEISMMDIPPVKHLIITHYHWDHVFGLRKMGLSAIAHKNAEQKVLEMQKMKWDDKSLEEYREAGRYSEFTVNCIKKEIPERDSFVVGDLDIIIEQGIKINLGGISCIVEPVGGDHTDDSLIVYVPEEKVMFLGDCVYGGMYNGEYGYTADKLFPMIQKIEKYEADCYLISHEELYSRAQISELWSQLRTAGTVAGNAASEEEAVKRFYEEYKREPSRDEADYIRCFVSVNKAGN